MNFFPDKGYGYKQKKNNKMEKVRKERIKITVNQYNEESNKKGSNDPYHLFTVSLGKIKYALIFFSVYSRIDIQPANDHQ
jgi:hypothetical protein